MSITLQWKILQKFLFHLKWSDAGFCELQIYYYHEPCESMTQTLYHRFLYHFV